MGVVTQILPDIHVPFEDKRKVKAALDWGRSSAPDRIVLLGDVMENHALSTHRKDPRWEDNLDKEIKATRKFLEQLRDANPKADITYIVGNHEARWYNQIQGRIPALRLLGVDLRTYLGVDDLGLRWHDDAYKGVRVPVGQGQVAYCYHGDQVQKPQARLGVAASLAKTLGQNVICGHTHKHKVTWTRVGQREVFGLEAGNLVNAKHKVFRYAGRVPEWTAGFLVADSTRRDSPLPHFVKL